MYKGSVMEKLADNFSQLINGDQTPRGGIRSDLVISQANTSKASIVKKLIDNSGPMYQHFAASVPYILEEHARIVQTIANISEQKNLSLWEMDSFDGTMGRTLAEYSKGRITTLSSSPNKLNKAHFEKLVKDPSLSRFVDSSLFDVHDSVRESRHSSYDILYEMAAFQFYGLDRSSQIARVKEHLKTDGLLIFLQKVDGPDYELYEKIKDEKFKSRYFSKEEISRKNSQMLTSMHLGQVSLEDLKCSIDNHFSNQKLVWSSTNFVEIVASDSRDRLDEFLGYLGEVYLPGKFIKYESEQK